MLPLNVAKYLLFTVAEPDPAEAQRFGLINTLTGPGRAFFKRRPPSWKGRWPHGRTGLERADVLASGCN